MPIRIVQLGSPRHTDEGLRIGTVRRPPRGVPKAEFASRDYYDVWYPELSPQPDTMHTALESHRLQDHGQQAEADKEHPFEQHSADALAQPLPQPHAQQSRHQRQQ